MKHAFAAALLALSLAACGQDAPPAETATPPAAETDAVVLGSTQNMPDWLFILRTNDGGTIHFNQRAITRSGGFADIWLQVRYGRQQLFAMESDTQETVVRYELERIHYRFNCTDEKFIIVERQIMGASEEVVARDEPTQIWRMTPETGAARHVLPIACRGA